MMTRKSITCVIEVRKAHMKRKSESFSRPSITNMAAVDLKHAILYCTSFIKAKQMNGHHRHRTQVENVLMTGKYIIYSVNYTVNITAHI